MFQILPNLISQKLFQVSWNTIQLAIFRFQNLKRSFRFRCKIKCFFFTYILFILINGFPLHAVDVRIGDLVKISGTRDNQITGYGLVVGLPGTGDTRSPLTGESLQNYLNNLGVDSKIKIKDTRNVASVIVSANVPIWTQIGDKIDVTVSSIGDARSLEGGVLLQSPMKAGNGTIIAVASGNLQFGSGDESGKRAGSSKRNQGKNAGMVQSGAIIEREIKIVKATTVKIESDTPLTDPVPDEKEKENQREKLRIQLLNPSYSTLNSILEKLESEFGDLDLQPVVLSKKEFEISLPRNSSPTSFLATLENLKVEPETPARVVINEKSGILVMGGNLAVDEVAISKQGLNLKSESKGKSKYFWSDTNDKQESVFYVKKTNNVKSLVDELNRIGASTKDIISILQSLKQSGSLHAEVIVQ